MFEKKFTLRFYKMKEGFTFGENVTERDIENHKKMYAFQPHEYLVVMDANSSIVYTDGFEETDYDN